MSTRRRGVDQLARLIQQLTVQNGQPRSAAPASNRRRRNRRRRARKSTRAEALPPAGQPGMVAASNPRRGAASIMGGEGHMRVSRDELCASVTTGDGGDLGDSYQLNPAVFSWLKGIAASWDRVVWHSVSLSWRPAVGTTTDGIICYGFDWDPSTSTKPKTRAAVCALTPVKDHAIWQATDRSPLTVRGGQLQSRRYYLIRSADAGDKSPATILLYITGAPAKKMVGELWIRYDVSFSGPREAV